MIITALYEKIIAHAKSVFPQESCGLVVEGDYLPLENISERPMASFKFHAKYLVDYAGRIDYLVHSHPENDEDNALECPSSWDMQQQMSMELPWMIVPLYENGRVGEIFTFGERLTTPLLGRPFRHGVTDCYGLMRDAYALGEVKGLKEKLSHPRLMPDFPRDWGWWHVKGVDLYERHFRDQGFRVLDHDDALRPWDALLCAVGSPSGTPNHAILYLGNNLGLHHVGSWRTPYDPTRLSTRENISRWIPTVRYRLRPTWHVPSAGGGVA